MFAGPCCMCGIYYAVCTEWYCVCVCVAFWKVKPMQHVIFSLVFFFASCLTDLLNKVNTWAHHSYKRSIVCVCLWENVPTKLYRHLQSHLLVPTRAEKKWENSHIPTTSNYTFDSSLVVLKWQTVFNANTHFTFAVCAPACVCKNALECFYCVGCCWCDVVVELLTSVKCEQKRVKMAGSCIFAIAYVLVHLFVICV